MTSVGRFTRNQEATATLLRWWRWLEHHRGDRAMLRRARSPEEVAFCPAYHVLLGEVEPLGFRGMRSGLGGVAGLLAHVRNHVPRGLASRMAMPGSGSRGAVSPARFRRLLESRETDDLFRALRRILGLLEGTADIPDLADGYLAWGPEVRKRWAYDYYSGIPGTKGKEEAS